MVVLKILTVTEPGVARLDRRRPKRRRRSDDAANAAVDLVMSSRDPFVEKSLTVKIWLRPKLRVRLDIKFDKAFKLSSDTSFEPDVLAPSTSESRAPAFHRPGPAFRRYEKAPSRAECGTGVSITAIRESSCSRVINDFRMLPAELARSSC